MTAIALGLCCLGCLLLSVSLRRHYRQVFSDESAFEQRLWRLRWSGYGLVFLAIWPCVRLLGLWIGLILWISMVALAAFLQIMLLTYRPRSAGVLLGFGVVMIAVGALL